MCDLLLFNFFKDKQLENSKFRGAPVWKLKALLGEHQFNGTLCMFHKPGDHLCSENLICHMASETLWNSDFDLYLPLAVGQYQGQDSDDQRSFISAASTIRSFLSNFKCLKGPPRLVFLGSPFGYGVARYPAVTCWVGNFFVAKCHTLMHNQSMLKGDWFMDWTFHDLKRASLVSQRFKAAQKLKKLTKRNTVLLKSIANCHWSSSSSV